MAFYCFQLSDLVIDTCRSYILKADNLLLFYRILFRRGANLFNQNQNQCCLAVSTRNFVLIKLIRIMDFKSRV